MSTIENLYSRDESTNEQNQYAKTELPLVMSLHGYADAGQAVDRTSTYLEDELDGSLVASFDADSLTDYRARRPPLSISNGRIVKRSDPDLHLWLKKDKNKKPFLLLSGPEPDFRWKAFSQAVADILDDYTVKQSISLYGYETNHPHTRPVLVSGYSNNESLLSGFHVSQSQFTVHSSASMAVEQELEEAGTDYVGITAHVPNYVSAWYYPAASLKLLSSISEITGLEFSTAELEKESDDLHKQLEQYVQEAPDEFVESLSIMEEKYDEKISRFTLERQTRLLKPGQGVPTAEELGEEIEQFLAKNIKQTRPFGELPPSSENDNH